MGFLICDKCKGYYELQPGESPEDFDLTCECGGSIRYADNVDFVGSDWNEVPITTICPKCGTTNPEGSSFCSTCAADLTSDDKTTPPSKNGVLDFWDKQSTGGKAVIGILGVCFIGFIFIILVAGMGSHNTNSLSQSPAASTQSQAQTADATMSESEYIPKAQTWIKTVGDALDSAASDMDAYSNGGMTDSQFISNINGYKSTIDDVLNQEKIAHPPARFTSVHQQVVSAEQDMSNALGYAIKGAQSKNVDYINKGTDLMNSGRSKMEQANNELSQMG